MLIKGQVVITDNGTQFTDPPPTFGGLGRHDVQNDFTVKTQGVQITEPPDGLFEYGLVQNVMFDHFEATFDPKGDMLVDSVGPFVDVGSGEQPPFIHETSGNLGLLTRVAFLPPTLDVNFRDLPSWPLPARVEHCNQQVFLMMAMRSLMFRVGLVSRETRTGQLTQLGAIATHYLLQWNVEVNAKANTRKLNVQVKPDGTKDLAIPGPRLALNPPTAVAEGQQKFEVEAKDLATRCENVLS